MNNQNISYLVQVALPVPLYHLFDYVCPDELLTDGQLPVIGGRVQVPFGKQTLVGIVISHPTHSEFGFDKLKPILQLIDKTPIIDEQFIRFARWLSQYYHYPLGETLFTMLPVLLKQGKALDIPAHQWQISKSALDDNFVRSQIKRSAKTQFASFELIKQHPNSTDKTLKTLGVSTKQLAILEQKGLIVRVPYQLAPPKTATLKQAPLTLNHEQQHALDTITKALDTQQYQGILLHGVTGSGKTEVYLQAINHALQHNQQVLVLLPEIGLTPQSQERFAKRFDASIITLHSKQTDSERLHGWQACQNGQAQIIIATRSSLFYPFKQLGLIIIDEAHDSSFKQQDHLRYHACDVALYLGFCQKVPVVLATATPSLEQYKLVQDGKLTLCTLTQRTGGGTLGQFRLIDMRLGTHSQADVTGQYRNTELSPATITAIRQTLERGEQVLVFLNRRGFAPILLCGSCGKQADCVRCSSHLTLHKSTLKKATHPNAAYLYNYLKCHHCSYQVATPSTCPSCHSPNLIHLGQGTSQLFEHLHGLFANPQNSQKVYSVLQIDRDTVTAKGAWHRLYQHINTGQPMILVGTQMLAKGHHFEGVTLVVVADADAGFLSPNFRSPEHTAQTIIQVAGRAGRSQQHSQVLIQTYTPDNPLLVRLIKQGYDSFAKTLLNERKQLGLPPFSHATLIKAEARNLEHAKTAIMAAKNLLPSPHPFVVLAPIEAPLLKKNNRYHMHMLILAKERKILHQVLNWWWQEVLALPSSKGVRLSIDIDPMGW